MFDLFFRLAATACFVAAWLCIIVAYLLSVAGGWLAWGSVRLYVASNWCEARLDRKPRGLAFAALAAIVILPMLAPHAFAADMAAQTLAQALEPYFVAVVMAVITVIIGLLARLAGKYLGAGTQAAILQVEASNRDALHIALATGADAAVAKIGAAAADPKNGAVKFILDHAAASVPDALAALAPPPDVAENLALAALQRSLGLSDATTPAAAGPVVAAKP